jgi:hypothetical protein
MPVPASPTNIQENIKTCDKKLTVGNPHSRPSEEQIEWLASLLVSRGPLGGVLRVLTDRLRHPGRPYTNRELEVLLLVTCALERAGLWS